ncbi:OprD family outer membrane porin, partial [Klebsiella pneumoniae]|uniref:OprD family outer membrane porin n=1 Tax=Klebsiella pneumoniae TaxID=573 RepID=UPI0023815EC7
NEVEAVIGHEMGHVALGHVKKGMQVALGTNAVRAAAASAGGIDFFAQDDDGRAKSDLAKFGATAKMRFSNTVLSYGSQRP